MDKIKIAFIKFGGMAAGGTERWLQIMAAYLPKEKYNIDYYYCDAYPYMDWKDADSSPERLEFMRQNNINLIKFEVKNRDFEKGTCDWINTNFWSIFDESKYDIIQTAKAGPKEYPYYLFKKPVVEFVALDVGVDFSNNIAYSIHPSKWQRNVWLKMGGNPYKSPVIPVPAFEPYSHENLRQELNIPQDAIVAGYHQRNSDYIFSSIPLNSFSKIEKNKNIYFIIMGGSNKYQEQAQNLNLKNVRFVEHNGSAEQVSKFLNTLDIFAHGRYDGETFGTVFAEALMHDLPCMSHHSTAGANAHSDTMGDCGLWALNQDDYTEKLDKLFSDKELRENLSKFAKDFSKNNYSVEKCIKKLENVYENVMKKEKISFNERIYHLNKFLYKFKIKQILRHPKRIFKLLNK